MPDFELPTDQQRRAYLFRTCQRLNDSEIARLEGVTRETVNRRIAAFHRRVARIRELHPELSIDDVARST